MEIDVFNDEYFMRQALQEAELAFEKDEVPIGAVVVSNKQIIGRAHNMTEQLNDSTAHAEMIAITAAQNYLGSKVLEDCAIYITLEPCAMCAGALYWSRISNVFCAAKDDKRGFSKFSKDIIHPKTKIEFGLLEDKASNLLRDYFLKKRK